MYLAFRKRSFFLLLPDGSLSHLDWARCLVTGTCLKPLEVCVSIVRTGSWPLILALMLTNTVFSLTVVTLLCISGGTLTSLSGVRNPGASTKICCVAVEIKGVVN